MIPGEHQTGEGFFHRDVPEEGSKVLVELLIILMLLLWGLLAVWPVLRGRLKTPPAQGINAYRPGRKTLSRSPQ